MVDARHALPIPAGLDDLHAAAIPEIAFTVYANVFGHGGLRAGETLLVHGATSGIGVMAIQMAKAHGAKVIATARGADKARIARELGADVAVDTTFDDFGAIAKAVGVVDVALDMVGAPYLAATLDALNTGGRILYIASQGGDMLEIPVWAADAQARSSPARRCDRAMPTKRPSSPRKSNAWCDLDRIGRGPGDGGPRISTGRRGAGACLARVRPACEKVVLRT